LNWLGGRGGVIPRWGKEGGVGDKKDTRTNAEPSGGAGKILDVSIPQKA